MHIRTDTHQQCMLARVHTHTHTYPHMCMQLTMPIPSSSGEEHKEAVSQHCKLVMETQGKMKEAFQVHGREGKEGGKGGERQKWG